jgi:PII-like signaling protein
MRMPEHVLGPGTMLVMICETPLAERLTQILEELAVVGYTRFSGVSGIGAHGRHEGSAVWPGTNTIIMTFVSDDSMVEAILRRNEEMIEELYARRPGYRVFSMPSTALA